MVQGERVAGDQQRERRVRGYPLGRLRMPGGKQRDKEQAAHLADLGRMRVQRKRDSDVLAEE